MRSEFRKKIYGWCLVFLLFSVTQMQQSGFSEGADSIVDIPEVMEIESPAARNNMELSTEDYFSQYFERWGKLDKIYDDHIVVGDHARHLAPGVNTTDLKEGDYVGLKMEGRNTVIHIEKLKYQPKSN